MTSPAGYLRHLAENQGPSQLLPGAVCKQGGGYSGELEFFWNSHSFLPKDPLYSDPALLLYSNCSSRADVDPAAFLCSS